VGISHPGLSAVASSFLHRVSPAPCAGGRVRFLDPSGTPLDVSVKLRRDGAFAILAGHALPPDFRIVVDSAEHSGCPTLRLQASMEGYQGGPIAVSPATTVICKYMDAHRGMSLSDAATRVRRALGIVNRFGARRSVSGGIIPAYDVRAFLEAAEKHGGPEAYLCHAADRVDRGHHRFPGISDGILDNIGSQMLQDLLSGLVSTLDAPVLGWIATALGINGNTSLPPGTQQILDDLSAITSLIEGLEAELSEFFLVQAFDSALAAIGGVEPDIETYANDLSTQPVGADLTTLLNNIFSNIAGSLITISNAQLGSPGATGFIIAWMAQYAPQYYCDAVALTVINQQFDHYQQLQFLAMGLLVEYYHWPQPGDPGSDPPTPPSPPQYYLANGVVSENAGASVAGYYDNIQAQASLLPFPSSGIGYTNEALNGMCDQIVYDTQNDIAWGYQNWAKASGNLTNIPALIGQLANCEGFVRVPTSEELSGMGSLGVAPAWDGPAYKYVSSVLGNQKVAPELFTLPNGATTLPQTPTWADMMSSLGFDTNILYSPAGNDPSVHVYMPFAALEILNLDLNNGSPWQRMMNGNGPSDQYQEGWECQLYSAATNNATQVQIVWNNAGDSGPNPSGNLAQDLQFAAGEGEGNVTTWLQFWSGDTYSCWAPSNAEYIDALLIYQLQATDLPLEEPSQIVVNQTAITLPDGTQAVQCNAVGTFTSSSPARTHDITEDCFWSVSGDPAASISNIPAADVVTGCPIPAIGVVTFTQNPVSSVTVTAQRLRSGITSPAATVTPPSGLPSASPSLLANMYPLQAGGTQNFNGSAPVGGFAGQVYVQRVLADGSSTDDDTANFTLSATGTNASYLDFYKPPTGLYQIPAPGGTNPPSGTTTIEMQAADNSEALAAVSINVVLTVP